MFNQESKIQLAVLQERFKAHEQIVERVDSAIQTLSETNQNICKMLAVHDERIAVNSGDAHEIVRKVEDIETKVDGLYKFRWQIGGAILIIVGILGLIPTFMPMLTPTNNSDKVERTK